MPEVNEITEELLNEFKERMKLGDDEDLNLTRILKASVEDLEEKCGSYDVHTSERFKELVFERSRYAYNDAIEYFDKNFLTQIANLQFSMIIKDLSFVESPGETVPPSNGVINIHEGDS